MTQVVDPSLISLVRGIAASRGVSPQLMCAVIEQESSWDPWAIRYEPAFMTKYVAPQYTAGKFSATEAYARAMSWGLAQIMGATARELGYAGVSLAELCDPKVGADWGVRDMKRCLDRAKGDEAKALLGWNGGRNVNYAAEVLARKANYAKDPV